MRVIDERLWQPTGCNLPEAIAAQISIAMSLPRRIRPLTRAELEHLTVDRLLAYRKQALSLENSLPASDYTNVADSLDNTYLWFKDDPRWQPLYESILDELARKQTPDVAD